jgi:hypothetical protein
MGHDMMGEEGSRLLFVRHTIKVNEQVVYVGEDWAKAQMIFIRQVQSLDLLQVSHVVQKQAVAVYHDPRAIKWDEV